MKYSIKKFLPVFAASAVVLIAGCAGKTANPVASYKVGDESMSCQEVKVELAHIDSQVAALIPESEKTGKNVALGVAGAFLIVPWFFMDVSDAEETEIKAYRERYVSLEKLYVKNECSSEEGGTQIAGGVASSDKESSIADKLKTLDELKVQGYINDEEYKGLRAKILGQL